MIEEEKIKQELEGKFSYLKDAVVIKRDRRIFASVSLEKFYEVFTYAIRQMRFDALSTITGMDNGDSYTVMYHLNKQGGIILSLGTNVSKNNPAIKTITSLFPNADIYERELVDLLGIQVEGLAAGSRYPLSDNWPKNEYPLRKEWKAGASRKDA